MEMESWTSPLARAAALPFITDKAMEPFSRAHPFAALTSVLVTGDFNGDGRVDLIAAGGGQMEVFFGLVPLIPHDKTTLTASPNPSMYYQAVGSHCHG